MEKTIATAVLNIIDANVIKSAISKLIPITHDQFQFFLSELMLGVIEMPDEFPKKVTQHGKELEFMEIDLNTMSVKYTFHDTVDRYFKTQEEADKAIEKHNKYYGEHKQSEEYLFKATIAFIDRNDMYIKNWLELSKEGE